MVENKNKNVKLCIFCMFFFVKTSFFPSIPSFQNLSPSFLDFINKTLQEIQKKQIYLNRLEKRYAILLDFFKIFFEKDFSKMDKIKKEVLLDILNNQKEHLSRIFSFIYSIYFEILSINYSFLDFENKLKEIIKVSSGSNKFFYFFCQKNKEKQIFLEIKKNENKKIEELKFAFKELEKFLLKIENNQYFLKSKDLITIALNYKNLKKEKRQLIKLKIRLKNKQKKDETLKQNECLFTCRDVKKQILTKNVSCTENKKKSDQKEKTTTDYESKKKIEIVDEKTLENKILKIQQIITNQQDYFLQHKNSSQNNYKQYKTEGFLTVINEFNTDDELENGKNLHKIDQKIK